MDRKFVDGMGRAGVAAVNLAVDAVSPKPGLPKAFMAIEPQFRYLVSQQKKYGYITFFNINITRANMQDVKVLTEIAHANGIGTDYHVSEVPLIEHNYYKHKDNTMHVTSEYWEKFDELIDWLAAKNRQGYPMVNSVEHLLEMKKFVRGIHKPWNCRAGHNGSFISADGRIAPCFEMQKSSEDFGTIWQPRFNRLAEMKKSCERHCLSTCFYTMSSYYKGVGPVMEWMLKHSRVGSR